MINKYAILFMAVFSILGCTNGIDRKDLVTRNNPIITEFDKLSPLSVGNGKFCMTVDMTGLQTFPEYYSSGIPLGTQSEWGWHSFDNTERYTHDETLSPVTLFGKTAPYCVENRPPRTERLPGETEEEFRMFGHIKYDIPADSLQRKHEASVWFRQNPHRLHLGCLGLELDAKGNLSPENIQDISQCLDMWTGQISSSFSYDGKSYKVSVACHPEEDMVGTKIEFMSGSDGKDGVKLTFPYPTGGHTDDGCDWNRPACHSSEIMDRKERSAVIKHTIGSTAYYVSVKWTGTAELEEQERHYYTIIPEKGTEKFEVSCSYSLEPDIGIPFPYEKIVRDARKSWRKFWNTGGAIDFSGCTDPRASELERRVVLSQYLTAIQCSGSYPPAETGLTCNSWFGRPHLEMHWWHGVHYALWGRGDRLAKTLDWYIDTAMPKAAGIAARQGYKGVRWMKMTDNSASEAPSDIGSFLIWQQPHIIYFAELLYRLEPSDGILEKYKEAVFATADFMASFAEYDKEKDRYILAGLIPAQETPSMRPWNTFNPPFELAYWHYGLSTAIKWKIRLGLDVPAEWQSVANKLSRLYEHDGLYVAAESHPDSFSDQANISDHMAVLGAYGMLPPCNLIDEDVMKRTCEWITANWNWDRTWGWDFPMTAMCAARLGMQEAAVDMLLKDERSNTFLPNGHNYQNDVLRLYLPGNGALLAAVAMMCAGWTGAPDIDNPGFPQDGSWNVRHEGLSPIE